MASLPPQDFTKLENPPVLETGEALLSNFVRCSGKLTVRLSPKKSLDIYTEQIEKSSTNPERSVLFLHGMSFSSKNWVDIQSIFHVANWGWKAVAVDLPGYGQSKDRLNDITNEEFLASLITQLGLNKPVIVSPSMSGSFSLPFLFGNGVSSLDRASGFVPVAPVGTSSFIENYKKSHLPTLIVYGTNDLRLGVSSCKDLGNLPKGQYAPIEGAGHACYMNNPDAFHTYLYHFLDHL